MDRQKITDRERKGVRDRGRLNVSEWETQGMRERLGEWEIERKKKEREKTEGERKKNRGKTEGEINKNREIKREREKQK